jgi:hypothetical protein
MGTNGQPFNIALFDIVSASRAKCGCGEAFLEFGGKAAGSFYLSYFLLPLAING